MKFFPSRSGGNTWEWGPFWCNRTYIIWWMEPERPLPASTYVSRFTGRPQQQPPIGGWKKQPRFTRNWVQETGDPWRAGRGYAIKVGNHVYNFGAWRHRVSPVDQYQQLILEMIHEPQGDV